MYTMYIFCTWLWYTVLLVVQIDLHLEAVVDSTTFVARLCFFEWRVFALSEDGALFLREYMRTLYSTADSHRLNCKPLQCKICIASSCNAYLGWFHRAYTVCPSLTHPLKRFLRWKHLWQNHSVGVWSKVCAKARYNVCGKVIWGRGMWQSTRLDPQAFAA